MSPIDAELASLIDRVNAHIESGVKDDLEGLRWTRNADFPVSPASPATSINTTTWLCGPPPASGQWQRYPGRFLYNLRRTYPELVADDVLHMFAGSAEWGVTSDLRPETGADIIAPFDAIPRPDASFSGVIADPPYADHWQGQWHGDLPKPKHVLREAARLTKPGGLIAILHIIVIPAYKELSVERVALHPVLAGTNNAIRVLNVFRRAV